MAMTYRNRVGAVLLFVATGLVLAASGPRLLARTARPNPDLERLTREAVEKVSPSVVQIIVSPDAEAEVRHPNAAEDRSDGEEIANGRGPSPGEQSAPSGDPGRGGNGAEAPTRPPQDEEPSEGRRAGKERIRTGLVIGADGYVITSLVNVGDRREGLKVRLADGRTLEARRLGEDLYRDVALLKTDAEDLPVPEWGEASSLAVGQWVLAVGRALPIEGPVVSRGIVSAKDRLAGTALQTDANVSALNYGGALVDLRGRVVAMVAALGRTGSSERSDRFSDSGIGFAVPMGDILAELSALKRGQRIEMPFLGVQFNNVRLEPGALVTRVIPETAAAEADIREGDVIVEFDGSPIKNPFELIHQIGSHRVGEDVTVKIVRGEQRLTLRAKLKARPEHLRE